MKFTRLYILLIISALPATVFAAPAQDNAFDGRGHQVTDGRDNCVMTKWMDGRNACAPRPAPAPVAQPAPPPRLQLSKEERTVYFDLDKYELKPAERAKLDSLAMRLKGDRYLKKAMIVGYADRTGSRDHNQKLSERRVESVKSYLAAQGVMNLGVAETRGLGDTVPKTNCPDTLKKPDLIACLAEDRRVEIEVVY